MKSPAARLLLLLLAWGLVAAIAGAFHVVRYLPPVSVQLLIAGLTLAFSLALARMRWLGEAVDGLGVRAILAVHLARFVGIYFLWLQAQGRLPLEFAQRAGWGDIAAAGAALILIFWPEGPGFRRALFWWNVLGAADLFVAVGTAGWLNVTRPGSMIELTGLPLALIPLWIVPLLLSTHFHLLRRSAGSRTGTGRQSVPA